MDTKLKATLKQYNFFQQATYSVGDTKFKFPFYYVCKEHFDGFR